MTIKSGPEFEIHDPNGVLTPREREVLTWVVGGKENDVIALLLSITLGTVKFHIINLLRKFDAHNRQLLVSRAWKSGLVKAADHARHLALLLLIGSTLGPAPGTDAVPVRTPRVNRLSNTNRRGSDEHPVVEPAYADRLNWGEEAAA